MNRRSKRYERGIAMQINKEIIAIELGKLIDRFFQLPEVTAVKVRDVVMEKGEDRSAKLQDAMEKSYHDCCSDVDLAVLVTLSTTGTVTESEYMKRIDRFGISEENCLGFCFVAGNNMCRIIMKNGMRYDFGFEFNYDESPEKFSLERREEEYSNPNWSRDNVNWFWFTQIQALGKLYRKDFLIGSHLANMNLNETLVQQMVLRDMKYGTNHHRYGYEEELTYVKYQRKCPVKSGNDTFDLIADKLYSAALAYDELTKAFYPEYESRSDNFFEIWKCYEENRK